MKGATRILLSVLVGAVALVALALVLLNREPARLQLGVVDLPPVASGVLVAGALGAGLLLGLLLLLPLLAARRRRRVELERRVAELEREVQDLRTLPLRGDG